MATGAVGGGIGGGGGGGGGRGQGAGGGGAGRAGWLVKRQSRQLMEDQLDEKVRRLVEHFGSLIRMSRFPEFAPPPQSQSQSGGSEDQGGSGGDAEKKAATDGDGVPGGLKVASGRLLSANEQLQIQVQATQLVRHCPNI
jgi:hypothetical protein